MKTIILSILVLISTSIFAQLNVTQAVTAAALVNSLTGGNNGTVSNIIYTGNANSCGTFTTGATATNLGISSGILLTSGKSSNAVGPNDVSDKGSSMAGAGFALLDALAGANTKDACVLQFDFVPINNTITFKYVFGSEEYHEYVNGGYNDAFAFFLTGPNPSGGNYTNQNIALVPSTTLPVSIDNVNNGVTSIMGDCTFGGPSGPCVNCAYFVNNCSGTSIQYDGFTKVLTATANVTPCQTYTIKLAIADASDYVYDSGVFIEQGSFTGITPPGIISYTGPICGGVPVDFTYTGAGTPGTWTFPGGTPSTGSGAGPIAVSWASNGNYTVDLSVNIGCNTNVTEDITVSSAAPTIGSNSPICAGQTLNLTSSGGGTYQWSGPDGFTSNLQNPSISNATLAADGTYYLTVTSAGGCISNTSTVVSISSAISPTASSNTPICSGNNLNLSASGGATYHWEYPDGITTSDSQNPSISNATTSASGTYSVTVTAASGCNAITTTNVTVNALPVVTINNSSPVCSATNVNLSCTPNGMSYNWSGPNSFSTTSQNPTITGATSINAGVYSLTVTDGNTCTSSTTTNVTVNSNPSVSITATNVSCYGLSDGAGTTTVTGGTSPFNYSWSNSTNSQNLTGVSAGNYLLTVSDVNSCSTTGSVSITGPAAALSATITPTAVKCNAGTDGSVSLTPSGGTTPYSFSWSNGANTEDLSNISANTYSVTITDNHACQYLTSTTVTQPLAPLSMTNTITDVKCKGDATGVIDITVADGTSPYSYIWSNSAITQDLNNVIAGNYAVTISDFNNCKFYNTLTVAEPVLTLTISNTITDVLCNGNSTGAINVTTNGGTSPYTYSWTNGSNTEDISTIQSGNYALTVTDANLCKVYGAYTVTQPAAALSATITPTAVKCNAGTDGSVSLTPSGGTTPYSFSWSNGANTEDLSNISANTYSVTITDNHACQYLTSTTVTQPLAPLSMTNTITDVKCKGDATGVIDITVADGTSPYSYIWSNSAITQDLNNVIAGNYAVTISDFNNCKFYNTLTVAEPVLTLTISNTITDVLCNGNSTGAINVTTNGGTSPYTYSWTNGSNTEDISTIQSGNYALTATDANLCKVYGTYTVTQPVVALSATITPTAVKCNAGTDGSVSLTPSGGTTPYSFSWSNGANTEDLSNVSANTYSVTITDNHACQYLASTTVTQPLAPLSITSTITDVLCKNASIGAITISVLGGTPTYSYSWTGPSGFSSTTQNINSLKAGSYNITITDINNCKINSSLFINEPANILSLSVSSNVTICEGNQTNLTAQFNGGTSPYNYTWKDGNGNIVETNTSINNCIVNVSPTTTTNYFVYLTDNNGCTVPPKNIEVSVSNKINYSLTINNNLCYNSCKGSAKVNIISGGVAPYTYNWLNSNNFIPENNKDLLCKGINYRVEIKDSWGCTTDTTFNITEPSLLQFTSQSFPTKCFGSLDGTGFISPTGGTRPYTYQWNNVSSIDSIIITGAGTYNVTVYDYNNCDTTGTVTITQPLDLRLYPPEAKTVCKGQSTLLTSTQLGGTSPYTYTWTSPDGTIYNGNPINVNPINSSYYQVELTDANGCVKNSQTHVEVKPPLSLDMISDKYKICPADTIKLIANDVSGGLGFNYTLMLTDGTIITPEYEMIPENQDTTIWYYVTLSDNCTAEKAKDSVQVSIFPKPEIDFTSDIASGCPPQMIEFNFTTSDPLKKHYWDFGDNLNNYSTTNSVHSFDHSGMFDVTLSVVTNDGCKTSITKPEFINIYPTPKAIFSAEPSTASIINPEIEFLNYSESNLVNSWVFGDYDYSNDINPIHIYSEVGEYNVELIVKNEFECADTTSLPVFIKDEFTFYAPTAFSPGDDGLNDVFFITGSGINPSVFQLYIYDRWGEVVYQTNKFNPENNKQYGWDGRIKNRNFAETGTYTWYAVYKVTTGKEQQKSGSVTVIR